MKSQAISQTSLDRWLLVVVLSFALTPFSCLNAPLGRLSPVLAQSSQQLPPVRKVRASDPNMSVLYERGKRNNLFFIKNRLTFFLTEDSSEDAVYNTAVNYLLRKGMRPNQFHVYEVLVSHNRKAALATVLYLNKKADLEQNYSSNSIILYRLPNQSWAIDVVMDGDSLAPSVYAKKKGKLTLKEYTELIEDVRFHTGL